MDFFEKHNFPHNTSFTLERKEQIKGNFSLLIWAEKKLIGAGIYDPNIDKEIYDLYRYVPLEKNILSELIQNNGFVFLLADNHFYSASTSLINPISKKKTSILELEEEINKVFEKQ